VLKPRRTWANPSDYDAQARKLAQMFAENFRTFEQGVTAEVKAAGPAA
jgi:phosphoenolpyruvate carboxykinase (ATP)